MTGKTSIEWATAVWNPTTGCTRVSAGCDNCYAFALHDKRYATSLKAARERISDGLRVSVAKARELGVSLPWQKQYDLPFSQVQLLPDRLDDPLRHKKPERYFVDSMSDLFHEDVPDEYIAKVWWTMVQAKQHTFLILTKRPERMRAWLTKEPTQGANYIAPNIWLGVSVEDQKAADERIPHLLATPAAVRFLSCEPLLGPVDLDKPQCELCGERDDLGETPDGLPWCSECEYEASFGHWIGATDQIDWVIVGGESGPRARPMDLAWARALVAQCRAAGLAPFVKQLGSAPVECDDPSLPNEPFAVNIRESHGRDDDMAEWPDDLRVREWPAGYVPA